MEDALPSCGVAEVIVDVAAGGVDRPLHYAIPPELQGRLQVGHRVIVPLRQRQVEGFVVGLQRESDYPNLRPIRRLVAEEPVFGPEEAALAAWMSHRYLSLTVDALRCLLPPHSRLGIKSRVGGTRPVRRYRLAPESQRHVIAFIEENGRRAPAQTRILAVLQRDPPGGSGWERSLLLQEAGASAGSLTALLQRGLVIEETAASGDDGLEAGSEGAGPGGAGGADGARPSLTSEQQRALAVIEARLAEDPSARPVLLQGVTGSGKTEVYMRAAEGVLAQGGQALVLVPEIALTPQAVARFRARFGQRVALLHSRLAPGERQQEWWRIRRGDAPLVVGTRSAVFAPLRKLRLIVVDEEHEPSYKQDEAPRYHARDVAWERARRAGALLVLGSATPSAETYVRAMEGEMERVVLASRVHGRALPPVELVDMRQELKDGHRGILSRRLLEEMGRVLAEGHQIILFLNRRGYSSFVLCRECGGTVACPDCAVSMTYHAAGNELRCHYCDRRQGLPDRCPHCRSPLLRRFGTGTQRVEEAVKVAFPGVPTVRMDWDTTRRKGEMERLLATFRQGDARILIGTQMVAKGHDFPRVALVGAIAADSGLYFPDFRAAERTFQLLTQVAGRAGRADVEGRVIVQTYNPDHYSIQAAQQGDVSLFFHHDLPFRRAGRYPPFRYLARLLVAGEDGGTVRNVVLKARREAGPALSGLAVDVLGPAPAPIPRIQGRHRWHIVVKGKGRDEVREAADIIRQHVYRFAPQGISLGVDVDPMSML